MKHILLFLTFLLFMKLALSQSNISSEGKECNFIVDYYPMVYKAQLKYLEKDLDSAFYYLNIVKNKCGFLNTRDILERVIYAEIQIKRQNYNLAFESLENIILTGFPFEYLEYNESLEELKKTQDWKKLKQLSVEVNDRQNDFFNWELRNEILTMLKLDQEVRNGGTLDYERMKKVDDSNQKRMKEIFETYGYPNEKLIGYSNRNENVDISFMLMHFDDLNYFKPKLLDFIKKGECSPYTLANMVDSNDRRDKMYTYGIYSTVDSTEIKDFPNLDSRRKSIGLRSLKDHNKTMSLLMKKYKN
tara:strand:- start:10196 stop:11101 length:906 start_codon:yes stop_codon:yes gene_type:complete